MKSLLLMLFFLSNSLFFSACSPISKNDEQQTTVKKKPSQKEVMDANCAAKNETSCQEAGELCVFNGTCEDRILGDTCEEFADSKLQCKNFSKMCSFDDAKKKCLTDSQVKLTRPLSCNEIDEEFLCQNANDYNADLTCIWRAKDGGKCFNEETFKSDDKDTGDASKKESEKIKKPAVENNLIQPADAVKKAAFLQEPFIFQRAKRWLNAPIALDDTTPQVPYIGTYGSVPLQPRLIVKFSSDFFERIPEQIKDIVKWLDINQLELFWIVQRREKHDSSNTGSNNKWLLNNHFWAKHDIPKNYRTSNAKGSLFNKNFYMAVFSDDKSVTSFDLNEKPTSKNINIHDSIFSPNTAALQINLQSYVFWSLVYNEEDGIKKAAVTLHWILLRNNTGGVDLDNEIETYLNLDNKTGINKPVTTKDTMQQLIDAFKQPGSLFKDTAQLKELVKLVD